MAKFNYSDIALQIELINEEIERIERSQARTNSIVSETPAFLEDRGIELEHVPNKRLERLKANKEIFVKELDKVELHFGLHDRFNEQNKEAKWETQ